MEIVTSHLASMYIRDKTWVTTILKEGNMENKRPLVLLLDIVNGYKNTWSW